MNKVEKLRKKEIIEKQLEPLKYYRQIKTYIKNKLVSTPSKVIDSLIEPSCEFSGDIQGNDDTSLHYSYINADINSENTLGSLDNIKDNNADESLDDVKSCEDSFKSQKSPRLSYSDIYEENKFDDISHDKYILMIYFVNKNTDKYCTAYFKKTESCDTTKYLEIPLDSIGIHNIEFKFASLFPYNDLTYSLCDYYFGGCPPDSSIAVRNICKIHKCLNDDVNSLILKSISEFIHSKYEFSYGSFVDLQDVYNEYFHYNCSHARFVLNVYVDIQEFYEMLKLLYYNIVGIKLLNFTKRKQNVKVNLEIDSKIESNIKFNSLKKKYKSPQLDSTITITKDMS